MAVYAGAPFANPALNLINVNTVLNNNVVDTSIPPPNFTSNNVMQPAPYQSNQRTGQQFNFGQPANISHVPCVNPIGSPFPTLPPNIVQSQNFDPNPNQGLPVWKNSFQNNNFQNNAFSGPSNAPGFQLNRTENISFQNTSLPHSPENIPRVPPPVWQNNNSFNNMASANYTHKSDNVTPNHPPVFTQIRPSFPNELPVRDFHSAPISQNAFPSPINSTQCNNPPVWKSDNFNGNLPNNAPRNIQFNNFNRNQNSNVCRQSRGNDNQINNDFLKIQKTNVPDLKIFNNPEVVFNMSGSNLIPENVNVNSNQFNKGSCPEPNGFNSSPQNERMNNNRNFINNNHPFQQWNKDSCNISPKKEFGNRNTYKPFKAGLQFNDSRNRGLPQHNHQNLIDIPVLTDGNNQDYGKQESFQENQNTSPQAANFERRNFALGDKNDSIIHNRFSNSSTNISNFFKEHSMNSFQKLNNKYEDQDNVKDSKSWMPENIQIALKERNKLFFEAKRTRDKAVWEKYNTLKRQIDEDIRKAKGAGPGPKFRNFNSRNKRPIEKDLPFNCDICDRSFSTDDEYKAHCALHIKCHYDGCNFEAHPKIVFLHQKMQHETGYAEVINKLQDDEEIKKWREERKRNFPTAENILKRQAEQAEKEARGEVVKDQNFGRFKRQRRGPGNSRHDRFRNRDRKFRQRPRNKYSFLRENLEIQYKALKVENSDSEAESESHIKLPRFTGIKKELEPLPSGVNQDAENADNDTSRIYVSSEIISNTSKSQDENEAEDVLEFPVSQHTNHTSNSLDENEDDDCPLEIPISKVPLNEVPESFDNEENIDVHSQCINEDNNITETVAEGDSSINASVKEEGNLQTSGQDNRDNKKRRYEKNSHRKPPRPVLPSRRKNSLLGMLLQDEIRHERNVIMQCVRHIVRNKFFGIGSDKCNDGET